VAESFDDSGVQRTTPSPEVKFEEKIKPLKGALLIGPSSQDVANYQINLAYQFASERDRRSPNTPSSSDLLFPGDLVPSNLPNRISAPQTSWTGSAAVAVEADNREIRE
jgi:hypothetical protein